MNLPYIAIEGVGETPEQVLDSLIAIEPILVMMGWDNDVEEDWNNRLCDIENIFTPSYLLSYMDGSVCYNIHSGQHYSLRFKANEMDKLIKYLKL